MSVIKRPSKSVGLLEFLLETKSISDSYYVTGMSSVSVTFHMDLTFLESVEV